ncbi:hypothetical protein ACSHWB_44350 [Lentzea sp. HUAS TT2]|uniref:hypothetical protein n=1 Tax=Lentzea sp. HUAS TT2 TaxID=3447454 RepID=UPI003F711C48
MRKDWTLRRRCLVVFTDRPPGAVRDGIFGCGIVIPGRRATSYERRLEVEKFIPFSDPLPLDGVASRLKKDVEILDGDGPMTAGRGRRFLDALKAEFPGIAETLIRLEAEVSVALEIGDAADSALSQRDASNVLLTSMGMDRGPIRDWPVVGASDDFHRGIPGQAVPHEDDLIRWDSVRAPGWSAGMAVDWTTRSHRRGGRELRIHYGNARPLERQTGVDLIYYNAHHGCFVLVQYKKFKPDDTLPFYRPTSDSNFDAELARMSKIDDACGVSSEVSDIRLTRSATFFKFCEPVPFEAGTLDLVPGMYLSREHVEELRSGDPRPGFKTVRIDYHATRRYLNNTLFTALLGDGWIGTRGAATELVADQVAESLGLGRAVVLGSSPYGTLGNAPGHARV